MSQNDKIGLGTVQFGVMYGISNEYGQTSENEVSSILSYANEVGIDVLDTASAYGNSEKVLGRNDLSDFKIVSKFILQNSETSISKQLNDSLADLKVKSIYGYLSHRPMDIASDSKCWNELVLLKSQGLVEKIGFSFNEVSEIEKIKSLNIIPDIIQVPYNYLDNRFEPYMTELKSLGCEIHTRSAFLQGLFFCDTAKLSDFFNDVKPIIKSLQKHGEALPAMLLKYCTDKPFIDKVIFGVNTLSQLKHNIGTFLNTDSSLPSCRSITDESILIPSKWPK